jgi:hypothetical protein
LAERRHHYSGTLDLHGSLGCHYCLPKERLLPLVVELIEVLRLAPSVVPLQLMANYDLSISLQDQVYGALIAGKFLSKYYALYTEKYVYLHYPKKVANR